MRRRQTMTALATAALLTAAMTMGTPTALGQTREPAGDEQELRRAVRERFETTGLSTWTPLTVDRHAEKSTNRTRTRRDQSIAPMGAMGRGYARPTGGQTTEPGQTLLSRLRERTLPGQRARGLSRQAERSQSEGLRLHPRTTRRGGPASGWDRQQQYQVESRGLNRRSGRRTTRSRQNVDPTACRTSAVREIAGGVEYLLDSRRSRVRTARGRSRSGNALQRIVRGISDANTNCNTERRQPNDRYDRDRW